MGWPLSSSFCERTQVVLQVSHITTGPVVIVPMAAGSVRDDCWQPMKSVEAANSENALSRLLLNTEFPFRVAMDPRKLFDAPRILNGSGRGVQATIRCGQVHGDFPRANESGSGNKTEIRGDGK